MRVGPVLAFEVKMFRDWGVLYRKLSFPAKSSSNASVSVGIAVLCVLNNSDPTLGLASDT